MIIESHIGTSKQNKKLSPIVIAGKNVSATQQLLQNVITSKKFEVKLMRIGIRVDIGDKIERDQLIKHLDENKINYFGYHSDETRPRKIILNG